MFPDELYPRNFCIERDARTLMNDEIVGFWKAVAAAYLNVKSLLSL
jgi:hypothetical protein